MRITGPNSVTPPKNLKRRTASTSGAGFASSVNEHSAAAPTGAAQASTPISGIDSMLMIQSVDPDEHNKQAAVKQAGDVIDALEQVRRGILLGAIPVGRLQRLAGQLQSRLEGEADPVLSDILTDIVLRARVELAKAGIYKAV